MSKRKLGLAILSTLLCVCIAMIFVACGTQGEKGEAGKDGISIVSVEKVGSEGLTDTYKITYSDGNSTTFTVTNGKDGTDGSDGENGQENNILQTDKDRYDCKHLKRRCIHFVFPKGLYDEVDGFLNAIYNNAYNSVNQQPTMQTVPIVPIVPIESTEWEDSDEDYFGDVD